MQTSIHHSYSPSFSTTGKKVNLWKKFINWCDSQEPNRLAWTAIAITGHGCILTIITVITILLTGNNFIFWPFAIAGMAACLIVNLAALPTRITIPFLVASVILDMVIIGLCISNGFDLSASFR